MTTAIDEVLKKHQRGLVIVYTGTGKGKTAAALGQALRAIGHGKRVLIWQFMKGKEREEELAARLLTPYLIIKSYDDKSYDKNFPTNGISSSPHADIAEARRALLLGECDLLILDEASVAVSLGLFNEQALIALAKLVQDTPLNTDLLITGRGALPELIKIADTVSEFNQIKRHFC